MINDIKNENIFLSNNPYYINKLNKFNIEKPITKTNLIQNDIKFYRKGPYYEFSNYFSGSKQYPLYLNINGIEYSSTEAYFQSKKFDIENDTDKERIIYSKLISLVDSPQKAKDMGSQKTNYRGESWLINKNKPELGFVNDIIRKYSHIKMRSDWDQIKNTIMEIALFYKFTQNNKLKQLLKDTYPNNIIEDSPKDYYWGIGKDQTGLNILGKLLVQLRNNKLMN